MTTYRAVGSVQKELSTEGTGSPGAVARAFHEEHGRFPSAVEWFDESGEEQILEVLGGCDDCGGPIWEHEDYVGDPEGGYWHAKEEDCTE